MNQPVSLTHTKQLMRFAELLGGASTYEELTRDTREQWARLLASHSVTDAEVETLGVWHGRYCTKAWPTPVEFRAVLRHLREVHGLPEHRLQISREEALAGELLEFLQGKGAHLVEASKSLQIAANIALLAHIQQTAPGLPDEVMHLQVERINREVAKGVAVAVEEIGRRTGHLSHLASYLCSNDALLDDLPIDLSAGQGPEGFD